MVWLGVKWPDESLGGIEEFSADGLDEKEEEESGVHETRVWVWGFEERVTFVRF